VPHKPHELACPVHAGASSPVLPPEANIESFLVNLVELQCGHRVPVQSVERTSTSLFRSHFSQ